MRAEREWPETLVNRLRLVAQVIANALARRRADSALRESEERLSLAVAAAEAGIWVLDVASQVFWASEEARVLFGFTNDEVITMERFKASVHADDRDPVAVAIERSVSHGDPIHVEYRVLLPDGDQRWVSSRGRAQRPHDGRPDRLTGVSLDVTARRRDQEALRSSRARLEAAADLAGLGFYEVDLARRSVYVDDRFRAICGVPPHREAGLGTLEYWTEQLHPDDRERILEARERLHGGRLNTFAVEYRFLHPAEGMRWMRHLAAVAERQGDGRATKTYGVLRDVTEQRRTENELRELSRRLLVAHEEERALLARELHDDVSQRLAVLAIDVGRAELETGDETGRERMQRVRDGLADLSDDIHSMAYQLHPSILKELGLADALRAECERRGRQGQDGITLDLGPMPRLVDQDAALCLFRVAQEALNNVARHAGATTVTVTLRGSGNGLHLAVSDDGAGFDVESVQDRGHLGLVSMRERVRLVNGTLDIGSVPGRGTTVAAWVPAREAG